MYPKTMCLTTTVPSLVLEFRWLGIGPSVRQVLPNSASVSQTGAVVCTENLSSCVVVVKSAEDGV
jgi:hypothetical protein